MKLKRDTEPNLQAEYNLQFDIDITLEKYFILDDIEKQNLRYKIVSTIEKYFYRNGEK